MTSREIGFIQRVEMNKRVRGHAGSDIFVEYAALAATRMSTPLFPEMFFQYDVMVL